MSGYKMARNLKLTSSDRQHASMSVSLEVMLQMEAISEDLEKRLGVKLTRTQVLKHLIRLYDDIDHGR